MGLGAGKPKASKKSSDKDNSGRRYVAGIWENEGKDGATFLNLKANNPDPEKNPEYYKGNLLWYDAATEKYYRVLKMNIFENNKGPQNLTHNLVLDLNNEHHVVEQE